MLISVTNNPNNSYHLGFSLEVILVAPWWPSQPWFPHLLRLCVEHPLFLPYRQDLLSQQDQKYISDGKAFSLHV